MKEGITIKDLSVVDWSVYLGNKRAVASELASSDKLCSVVVASQNK